MLKKSIAAFAIVALPLGALMAAPKKTAAGTLYTVDAGASTLKWLGKKVTGQHHGTVKIKDGSVEVAGGAVTGGRFTIDLATIADEDLTDPSYNAKLVGHLKSPDWFNVAKYPTSTFVITKVEPLTDGAHGATHTITGNLTIKDITHPLSFPAKITINGDTVAAEAAGVVVDRTLWDLRYGSGKFFQNLGDKVINDDFWLDISLIAKK